MVFLDRSVKTFVYRPICHLWRTHGQRKAICTDRPSTRTICYPYHDKTMGTHGLWVQKAPTDHVSTNQYHQLAVASISRPGWNREWTWEGQKNIRSVLTLLVASLRLYVEYNPLAASITPLSLPRIVEPAYSRLAWEWPLPCWCHGAEERLRENSHYNKYK